MSLLIEEHLGKVRDLAGASVAIGVFDGCHLGHESLIESCVRDANTNEGKSVIITFDIDPDELFSSDLKKIMSNDQRLACLGEFGADSILAIAFNDKTASIMPADFLDIVFKSNLPRSIHVGSDFRFGKKKLGDIDMLAQWCDANGVELHVHDLVKKDGQLVKSTRIRDLLKNGDIEEANLMLGHLYTVCGKVKHGRGEGSSFGIATANVDAHCLLEDGVYAGYATIDGESYKAAINVGIPPTFEGSAVDDLEVHILNYANDLYGKELCVSFAKRLRPLIKFDSTEKLIEQINQDIKCVESDL